MANILVLEDQRGWQDLIASAIRYGRLPECTTYRAETYGEAVALIEKHRFRVALLDYLLEGAGPEGPKTGLDVAEVLRRSVPSATILLITLVDPQRLYSRCEALGVRLVQKARTDLEDEIVREVQEGLLNNPD